MQARGPLMMEHRLIEKILAVIQVGGIFLGLLFFGAIILPGQEIPDELDHLDRYLHKNAKIGIGLSPLVPVGEEAALSGRIIISPREAAAFAVCHLRQRGVKDILICESYWIAAPLSGYVVDALGSHTIEGQHFSVFRIGIRDGAEESGVKEEQYRAGTQFVFIALGWDSAGKPIWYPSCGPDYSLSAEGGYPEGWLSYEFLEISGNSRKAFEDLPNRYKSQKTDERLIKKD